MPTGDIGSEALTLMRAMAGDRADHYISESLLPALHRAARPSSSSMQDLRDSLDDPYRCLETIYFQYAFSRRGKDKAELAEQSLEALHRTCRGDTFETFLAQPDASKLWQSYEEVCAERGRKPMEQLNRGVLSGLAELAQEVYRLDGIGSIARWIGQGVLQTDRIEPQFLRMVDIRNVGPKLTSLLLRDVAFLYDLEDQVDPIDRLYLQPIDKWMRLIVPYLSDEPGIDDAADWVLAGKVAKHTRRAGVSGVLFNMGATYFGSREVRIPENFAYAVADLTQMSIR